MWKKILKDETGGELAEYAVVGAVLIVVAAATLPALGQKIASVFTSITSAMTP